MSTYYGVGAEFIVENLADPGAVDQYIHSQLLLHGIKTGKFQNEEELEQSHSFSEMLGQVDNQMEVRGFRSPFYHERRSFQDNYFQELSRGLKEAREVDAVLRSRDKKYSFNQFHPAGDLKLVDMGHNGYTWTGTRGHFAITRNPASPCDLESTLVSSPRLGSGNGVNVSILPVAVVVLNETMVLNGDLPSLLVWDGQYYRAAVYDPLLSQFKPTVDPVHFESRQLILSDTPEMFYDYRKNHTPGVPNVSVPQFIREGPYFFESAYHRLIGHWGNRDYSEYLVNQLTPKANWRWKLLRRHLLAAPTEEDVENFCHATLAEVTAVIGSGLTKNAELNCFLLSKAFEKSREPTRSYIVGQITGDSCTIHLPYVEVQGIQALSQKKLLKQDAA